MCHFLQWYISWNFRRFQFSRELSWQQHQRETCSELCWELPQAVCALVQRQETFATESSEWTASGGMLLLLFHYDTVHFAVSNQLTFLLFTVEVMLKFKLWLIEVDVHLPWHCSTIFDGSNTVEFIAVMCVSSNFGSTSVCICRSTAVSFPQ